MRSIYTWLTEYGESHQHPTNKLIHWICVPLIVLSLIGLLWSIPVPDILPGLPVLANWATLFIALALVYYLLLSPPLALGMLVFSIIVIAVTAWLDTFALPLWQIAITIFVVAWVGQFIGHRIEGKKPSFFKDIQFLLIGPLWLLAFIYRRFGWPY